MTFTFYGTGIVLYSVTDSGQGFARVSVDNNTNVQVIDLYTPNRTEDTQIYAVSGLTSNYHTLEVIVTGTKDTASTDTVVSIDRVDVSS